MWGMKLNILNFNFLFYARLDLFGILFVSLRILFFSMLYIMSFLYVMSVFFVSVCPYLDCCPIPNLCASIFNFLIMSEKGFFMDRSITEFSKYYVTIFKKRRFFILSWVHSIKKVTSIANYYAVMNLFFHQPKRNM